MAARSSLRTKTPSARLQASQAPVPPLTPRPTPAPSARKRKAVTQETVPLSQPDSRRLTEEEEVEDASD